jgi:hypothetical protein
MNLNHVEILLKLLVCWNSFEPLLLKPIHISENIVKNLTDPDPQKNFLILATKIAELQEQHRLTQTKTNELEKRTTILMRERDQVLLENGRIVAAKAKLESLCRELHRHNQQIRVSYFENLFLFLMIYFFLRMKVLNDNVKMKQNVEN